MNPTEFAQVLEEIADKNIRPDLDLLPAIRAEVQRSRSVKVVRLAGLRVATLLLLLVLLAAAIFSLPGIAQAVQKLFGYLPGAGVVEQGESLRVLAESVSETRDQFSLTVESAFLDAERTTLTYRIAGPFPAWEDPSLEPLMCDEPPFLRLEDGSVLDLPERVRSFGSGESVWQAVFPPIPFRQDRAVLVLPCLAELPADEGPLDWEIPLEFVSAPPSLTVYPLVEALPTVAELPGSPEAATDPQATGTPDPTGEVQLALNSFAALEDGYYLEAELSWPAGWAARDVQIFPDSLRLVDSAGQVVPVWPADGLPPFSAAGDLRMALKLQTGPIQAAGPASLIVDYVGVGLPAETRFTLDVGDTPHPGQTWDINQELVIQGYRLRVLSAEYIQPDTSEPPWLMLYLASEDGILTINAVDMEHEILGTGGSPGSPNVPFRAGWRYKEAFPTGQITVEISGITVRRDGPWSVTWSPPGQPEAPGMQATAAQPEAGLCLDAASLENAPGELPAGLGGLGAFSGKDPDTFVADLDGSEKVAIGFAEFPDLSPDGRRLVYRGPDKGLHVRELDSGYDRLIPGTIQDDVFNNWPRWSPDGQQIGFDRVLEHDPDIYLVNADGSDLRAVLDSSENENFLGWSPDGKAISYAVTTQDAVSVRVLDLESRHSYQVFQLPPGAAQVLPSTDGSRITFLTEQGIFLITMDRSEPALLLSSTLHLYNPVWSPDGQWLALTYWDPADDFRPKLGLLQPDTCQFILLRDQPPGMLWSWVE